MKIDINDKNSYCSAIPCALLSCEVLWHEYDLSFKNTARIYVHYEAIDGCKIEEK